MFRLESRQTCDRLLDASINTIKYLKGPHGGWIGPHISPWILSRKDGDSIRTFYGDGLVINLPWEYASHGFSLGKRIFKFFKGCTYVFSIIHLIIIDPGCPSWSCQKHKLFWVRILLVYHNVWFNRFHDRIINSKKENIKFFKYKLLPWNTCSNIKIDFFYLYLLFQYDYH